MRGVARLTTSLLSGVLAVACGASAPGPTIGTMGHPTPPMEPRTAGAPFDPGVASSC